jgi:uracil-DNA glycosylase family 4
MPDSIRRLCREITACRRCPRLVAWRARVAREKVRRFENEKYWGRPVPGFGDSAARVLVVGLAPAAHGGNRTGRVFTGDRSGDWLYRALYKAGFANQARSERRGDGLELRDCYVLAAVRCAPPENKPLPREEKNCRPYFARELALLRNARVIVALGKFAWDASLAALQDARTVRITPRPKFAHGAEAAFPGGITLIGSYHPSQQNTFTGKLTEPMFDRIFVRAKKLLAREA